MTLAIHLAQHVISFMHALHLTPTICLTHVVHLIQVFTSTTYYLSKYSFDSFIDLTNVINLTHLSFV